MHNNDKTATKSTTFSECCAPRCWLVTKPRGVAVVRANALAPKLNRRARALVTLAVATKDSPTEDVILSLWSLRLVPGDCYLTPSIYSCRLS